MFSTQGRYRALCFTYNNPPDDVDGQSLVDLLKPSYLIVGKEVGESGTPHLQGYVEFTNQRTGASLKKKLPTVHFEQRMGTPKQAADYCRKEDPEPFESGSMSSQGKRTDLAAVRDAVVSGKSNFRDIAQDFPSTNAHRTAITLLTYFEPKRRFKPTVTWIYGPSGSGKSRFADETSYAITSDVNDIHTQNCAGKWWDGYDAHTAVVIDELRETFCNFADFLTLIDRYPQKVEIKGGYRQMRSKYMFITSCFSPWDLWRTNENIDQLIRRLDNIIELKCCGNDIFTHERHKYDAPLPDAVPIPQDEETTEEADDTHSVTSSETVRT